jgi:hypothetical protein
MPNEVDQVDEQRQQNQQKTPSQWLEYKLHFGYLFLIWAMREERYELNAASKLRLVRTS